VTTAQAAQISPPLTAERGDFLVSGGVPPRDHGPGGGPGALPPGRLTRRVLHILTTNLHGSLLAPVLVERRTGDSVPTTHAPTKGTA
jgi:hypothetical protein